MLDRAGSGISDTGRIDNAQCLPPSLYKPSGCFAVRARKTWGEIIFATCREVVKNGFLLIGENVRDGFSAFGFV